MWSHVRRPLGLALWIGALLSPLPRAQDLFPERVFPAGNDPTSIVTMHLDGDALPDVVVGNLGSFSRMLSLGDGSFEVLPELFLGAVLTRLSVADMNDDGIDDLIALYSLGQFGLQIWLGDGAGGLVNSADVSVGGAPYDVAAGDLDEDGDLDLVTANDLTDTVAVLMGDGAGGLAAPVQLAVSNIEPGWDAQPRGVALGDLDEDGHLDIASANFSFPGSLSLLFGDGAGGFTPAVSFQMGSGSGWYADAVKVADIDEDGHVDLVCNGAVRLGDGTGDFDTLLPGIASARSTLIDFDGDGHLDVVSANFDLTIALGNGQGGVASSTDTYSGETSLEAAVADYDADGDPDAAVVNRNSNLNLGVVKVFLNDGSGGVPPEGFTRYLTGTSSGIQRLTLADFDEDGVLDALTAHESAGTIALLRGDAAGGFQSAIPFSVAGPRDLALGDVDGDGHEDAAALSAPISTIPTSVALLLGDGQGGFAVSTLSLGVQTAAATLADVDEDGLDDLLTLNRQAPGGLAVRLADGSGGFLPPVTTPMFYDGPFVDRLMLADLDGDAHLDAIAVARSRVHILHGDGAAGFGPQHDYDGLGGGPFGSLVLADLDGDGDVDLLGGEFQGYIGYRLAVPGGYAAPVFFDLAVRGSPDVGDLDADGDVDIAVACPQGEDFVVLLGDGAGGFTQYGRFRAGGDNSFMAIADLDGSGFPDLVGLCAHSQLGLGEFVSVLLNQSPSPWLTLGHALAGSNGVPKLAGTGTLLPSSPLTLTIDDGRSFGSAVLAIGTPALNAPFKGGVFVPNPLLLVFGLPLNGAGHFAGSGTWYASIPSGLTLYFQAWMSDPAGPLGFSATNAISGTTP